MGLTVDAAAVLVAFLVVDWSPTVLALLLVNVTVSSAVSLGIWRRSLRRAVASVPDGAVMLPARLPTGRLLGSTLATATTLVLAVSGVVSPAVLGAGLGAKVGLLWSAREMVARERQDGSQVLRTARRRLGQPALYAIPSQTHGGRRRDPPPRRRWIRRFRDLLYES